MPDMESALAEMIEHSVTPDLSAEESFFDLIQGSKLATVVRDNGEAKTGAILKTDGRGVVFMEWKTNFVYRIPPGSCKQSQGQGFTVLSLSDTALLKNNHLIDIFKVQSLF